jgi:hypothetical protein
MVGGVVICNNRKFAAQYPRPSLASKVTVCIPAFPAGLPVSTKFGVIFLIL